MMSFLIYLKNVVKLNRSLFPLFSMDHRQIYSEWKSHLEPAKYPIDLELPWITIYAKNYIEDYLMKRGNSGTRVFEYGSGGSSLFFLRLASKVVSVEHDKKWFDLVSERVERKATPGWEGHLLEPELIGGQTGNDLDKSNPHHYYSGDENYADHTFRKYATFIDNFPEEYFDVVLVDGRSRPSCLMHSQAKIKKGGLLVLDNSERTYYLSGNVISENDFRLISSVSGALICNNQFTTTSIYIKK